MANRRRVRQCHAATAALLWVMGQREAGLLVILRRLHLRYAVTRGLVCATEPSSPPRVTLTLYRPFRTILQRRDCLLHVRYRDGARVADILAYLCSMLPEPSGNKNRPFAHASRPKSYRFRPPPYPRLRFGLRAYDTYRENAARSPCSSLVLRRRGTAGQLLLVSLSPRRSYSRNHSSRPASTASLSTSKGTSCGPLVCLCYCLLYTSPSPRD